MSDKITKEALKGFEEALKEIDRVQNEMLKLDPTKASDVCKLANNLRGAINEGVYFCDVDLLQFLTPCHKDKRTYTVQQFPIDGGHFMVDKTGLQFTIELELFKSVNNVDRQKLIKQVELLFSPQHRSECDLEYLSPLFDDEHPQVLFKVYPCYGVGLIQGWDFALTFHQIVTLAEHMTDESVVFSADRKSCHLETKTPFSLELQGVAEHEDKATEITVYRTNKGDD